MKYFEIIILLGLIIVLPLDFFNVIQTVQITTIYLSISGLFYFTFGIAIFNAVPVNHLFSSSAYKNIGLMRIIGGILTGICIALLCYAINMKFTDFPGATIATILFTFCLFIILIISVTKYFKSKAKIYAAVIIRCILFMSIGITTLSISKLEWIKSNYSDHPDFIKASDEYFSNPDDSTLFNKWEQEFDKVH